MMPFKDPEKRKEWQRQYNLKNPDKYKEWYEKNKEHRQQYMKKYRSTEKYRLMKKEHDKTYRLKHGHRVIWCEFVTFFYIILFQKYDNIIEFL